MDKEAGILSAVGDTALKGIGLPLRAAGAVVQAPFKWGANAAMKGINAAGHYAVEHPLRAAGYGLAGVTAAGAGIASHRKFKSGFEDQMGVEPGA